MIIGAGETLHTIYPFPEGFNGCSREKGRVDEIIVGDFGWKRLGLRELFGRVYSCLGTKLWRLATWFGRSWWLGGIAQETRTQHASDVCLVVGVGSKEIPVSDFTAYGNDDRESAGLQLNLDKSEAADQSYSSEWPSP